MQFDNVYAIIDAESSGTVDLTDIDALTDMVDLMYEHPVIKSRLGLASSLNGIVKVVDTGNAIIAVASLAGDFAKIASDAPKAAQELSALIKGAKRKIIIKNALLYGAGRRAGKLQAMLDAIDGEAFSHIYEFTKTVKEAYLSGRTEDAAKAFDALLYLTQKNVADEQADNLANGLWAKIVLQDFIVRKWKEANIINDSTYENFKKLNVYSKDTEGFWNKPIVRKLFSADQYYDLITDADLAAPSEPLYDFQSEINRTTLNRYQIAIPENIINNAELGQPKSITFNYNGTDIFTSYPDAISNRTNISGTEIPESFIFDLAAYPQLKSSASLNVIVDYGDEQRKYAADYLIFLPEISSVTVLSPPAAWNSEEFSLNLQICGDETSGGYIWYKKAEDADSKYQSTSFRLSEPETVDGDCRTYSVAVNGWDLMWVLGGNRDVSLTVEASGISVTEGSRSSAELTRKLVNLNDLDDDGLPDSWEEHFFGDISAQSAADDPDGDNVDNLFEYQHETDPTKPGIEGITKSIVFEPVQNSSGEWQNDFVLDRMYWANVTLKGSPNVSLYDDEIIVQGNFYIESGTLDLNGSTLIIMGNLIQSGGELKVNGGRLIVKGDYRLEGREVDGYMYNCGLLNMTNESDHVLVEGDFIMSSDSYHESYLTAGILELKGNFIQKSDNYAYKNFDASGMHKVLLSGSGPQNVSFQYSGGEGMSHFNILEITNPDPTKITFSPCWPAVTYSGEGLPLGNVNIGTVDFILSMDMTVAPSEESALWLYAATLNLNGHTLTVEGDLVQSGGELKVNGGRLIVKGDYRLEGREVDGYMYNCGLLNMTNESDHVLVEGDFIMSSDSYHESYLTAGILELKGNFIQKSDNYAYKNFDASGMHKVLLSGSGPQNVSFQYSGGEGMSHFNILEITNPDPTKITFSPCWPAVTYSGEGLPLGNVNIGTVDFILSMDMTVAPSEESALWLYAATLNLNGHTLTVEGDLVQSGGELKVNGGRLIVKGDYRLEGREVDGYMYNCGLLNMTNESDHVLVEGDFIMSSDSYHESYLTAGILELKGNFIQKSDNYAYKNFDASGMHKVLLSGSGPQIVSFQYAGGEGMSHFNELVLNNPSMTNFTTAVAVTKLFNHQLKPFTLSDPDNSSFVDYDGDSVKDNVDAYPLDPNRWILTDSDGDGVLDDEDAFPEDPSEWLDTDNDGIGNNADLDDDNDGVADSKDAFPLDASEWSDTDGDGIGNNADLDDDNDGIADDEDAFPLDATEWLDTDKDGIGNNADLDDDNDGVADSKDAFPLDASEWSDTDGDGQGDNADTDDDNDGIVDTADNCPLVANPNQEDENGYQDGDGIGDACETLSSTGESLPAVLRLLLGN
ncbi:hypothetical protein GCAAIG_07470 [Candidatus Electronema halotolerans]